MEWPTWEEWLQTLPAPRRSAALELRDEFARLGATDPEEWARCEISEGIPQLARFLLLRRTWPLIDIWRDEDPVANFDPELGERLRAAGIRSRDLGRLLLRATYEAVFAVLDSIDEGYDPEAPDNMPGWRLMETDSHEKETGRIVGGLHESLLVMDPRGLEGGDFLRP